MPVLDLAGRTFGRLTVLERTGSRSGKSLWRCRCSCGTETVVLSTYLTTGDTRSCGCLHLETTAAKGRAKGIDLTGQRFGRLLARCQAKIPRTHRGEYRWLCDCDCGNTHAVSVSRLRLGVCLSCGCLRDELARSRAATVGAMRRVKACRTCGRIYEAVGPQKECSAQCRAVWHTADEARRREEKALAQLTQDVAALAEKLNRRLQS